MKFIKFPIVPILFGFIIGILVQHFCDFEINAIFFTAVFSIIGFAIAYFLNTKMKFQSYSFDGFVLIQEINTEPPINKAMIASDIPIGIL